MLGLRWEWLGVPKMLNGLTLLPVNGVAGLYGISGEGNLFNPGVLKGTAPTLLDFAGKDKGRPYYNDDWNNFAPYFGFAFSPSVAKKVRRINCSAAKAKLRFVAAIRSATLRDGLSVHRAALISNPGLTYNSPQYHSDRCPDGGRRARCRADFQDADHGSGKLSAQYRSPDI